nr:hypothetical protein BN993_05345 [Virgibacillus halodenitrificans]
MRSRNAQREEAHQPPAESGIFPRSGNLRNLYILSYVAVYLFSTSSNNLNIYIKIYCHYYFTTKNYSKKRGVVLILIKY